MSEATAMVIRKSIVVEAPVGRAFDVFTKELASWWPLATHSVAQERAETAVLEEGVGGRVYERSREGEEADWGRITVWDPPHRLVLTWHPGRGPETAQEVELRFASVDGGTQVELEHRGWEKLGDRMAVVMAGYEEGWDHVLGERYAAAAKA
jgi:uncharacterized protein YndB with AHSA1/START domain